MVEDIEKALTPETEVLVTDPMPKNIECCKGLRWIHLFSAGTNQLLGHPLMKQPIRLSNSAGICAVHMAEYAVGQLLRHVKRFDVFAELQAAGTWPADRVGLANPSLRGRHAVIVGYGGVGRETARLLKAFGMTITAVQSRAERQAYRGYMPYTNTGDPEGTLPDRIVTTSELADVLPEADVVLISLPLTKTTHHLFDEPLLAQMQRDAILINVSRGAVIRTEALIKALEKQQLAHAYLDVFEQEPLPANSPIWSHPGITVSPHMSGVMPDAMAVQEALFLDNLNRYKNHLPLLNELNRELFVDTQS